MQSVLKQTYPHIEHVVVDGASSDGTVEMLRNYSVNCPGRVRFVSEPDKGAGEALNKSLGMAKGDLFSCLGSDDTLGGEDTIEAVGRFFAANPAAYFVHGHCNCVDQEGELLWTHRAEEFTL